MPYHLTFINIYLLKISKVLQKLLHVFISILTACGGTAIISFSEQKL